MKAIILQSSKSATQSGNGSEKWILEFETEKSGRYIESHRSMVSCDDPTTQVHLEFEKAEDAIDYANKNNIQYELIEAHKRVIKPKSYAKNFL
jgi:NADH dehydrogenase (ubiquinone) Fe-S protein 4